MVDELKETRETLVSCLHTVKTLEYESKKIPELGEKINKLESLVIDRRFVGFPRKNLS